LINIWRPVIDEVDAVRNRPSAQMAAWLVSINASNIKYLVFLPNLCRLSLFLNLARSSLAGVFAFAPIR
jgi:hypothetical protein